MFKVYILFSVTSRFQNQTFHGINTKAHESLITSINRIFVSFTTSIWLIFFMFLLYWKKNPPVHIFLIINTVCQKMFASEIFFLWFRKVEKPICCSQSVFTECFFPQKSYTQIREWSFLLLFGVFLMRYTVQKSSMASTKRKFKLNG